MPRRLRPLAPSAAQSIHLVVAQLLQPAEHRRGVAAAPAPRPSSAAPREPQHRARRDSGDRVDGRMVEDQRGRQPAVEGQIRSSARCAARPPSASRCPALQRPQRDRSTGRHRARAPGHPRRDVRRTGGAAPRGRGRVAAARGARPAGAGAGAARRAVRVAPRGTSRSSDGPRSRRAARAKARPSRPGAPRPAPRRRPSRASSAARPSSGRMRPMPCEPRSAAAVACARGRADLGPRAPVDAQRGQAARPAVVRERVEERRWPRRGWPGPASRAARRPTRTARRSRAAVPRSHGRDARRRRPSPPSRAPKRRRPAAASTPSSSTPAACTTPRSGGSRPARSRRRTRVHRRAFGDVGLDDRAPARPPRRERRERGGRGLRGRATPMSTSERAPRSASQRATASPSPPRPPVTRYVASGGSAAPTGRRTRGTRQHDLADVARLRHVPERGRRVGEGKRHGRQGQHAPAVDLGRARRRGCRRITAGVARARRSSR